MSRGSYWTISPPPSNFRTSKAVYIVGTGASLQCNGCGKSWHYTEVWQDKSRIGLGHALAALHIKTCSMKEG